MATILTKKKDTTGAPSAGDLTNSTGGAELAVNTADKRLYTKDSGGNVVEVGINPTSITTGTLNTSGAVVFNDAGADVDFRVEGDTDANLLFVDASTDRVGIGTSSPSVKLDVSGTLAVRNASTSYINTFCSGGGNRDYQIGVNGSAFVFNDITSGTSERMRIDSSGNLLVGTTGLPLANGKLTVSGLSRFFATGDSTHVLAIDKDTATTTTSQVFAFFTVSNQAVGSGQINANGASQAAFGSFSDRRLKQNIVNLDSQWEKIKALRPVEFDYIESEGGGHQIGFIAQEVEPVYPDLVGERADGMLTLSGMGKNESRLIKALQEAIERIETLEASNTALEARIAALEV